ncbi:MAG: hypothetical protein HYY00_06695 [Chloroflexi bacterium]|nr:hypothetical protein [Chloroflexota bacterium]
MDEKVLTRHPEGKRGRSISRAKYEAVRQAILDSLAPRGELTHTALTEAVVERLKGKFTGSIPWYMETVKLDLEAKGIIQRVPNTRPQHVRLVK